MVLITTEKMTNSLINKLLEKNIDSDYKLMFICTTTLVYASSILLGTVIKTDYWCLQKYLKKYIQNKWYLFLSKNVEPAPVWVFCLHEGTHSSLINCTHLPSEFPW
jgi:hypothetical protein